MGGTASRNYVASDGTQVRDSGMGTFTLRIRRWLQYSRTGTAVDKVRRKTRGTAVGASQVASVGAVTMKNAAMRRIHRARGFADLDSDREDYLLSEPTPPYA